MYSSSQRILLAFVAMTYVMQSCAISSYSPPPYITPENDTFATLFRSNSIFHVTGEPAQIAFHSPQEWQAFLQIYPTRDLGQASRRLSQVDYSQYMVIGIILGAGGTGGSQVTIDSIKVEERYLKVYSHKNNPSIGSRVMTNPAHFVVIEQSGLELEFEPDWIERED